MEERVHPFILGIPIEIFVLFYNTSGGKLQRTRPFTEYLRHILSRAVVDIITASNIFQNMLLL